MSEERLTPEREAEIRDWRPRAWGATVLDIIKDELLAELTATRRELAEKNELLRTVAVDCDDARSERDEARRERDEARAANEADKSMVGIMAEQIAKLTGRELEMRRLLRIATTDEMGGTPDLFQPDGGWEKWDEDVCRVIESGLDECQSDLLTKITELEAACAVKDEAIKLCLKWTEPLWSAVILQVEAALSPTLGRDTLAAKDKRIKELEDVLLSIQQDEQQYQKDMVNRVHGLTALDNFHTRVAMILGGTGVVESTLDRLAKAEAEIERLRRELANAADDICCDDEDCDCWMCSLSDALRDAAKAPDALGVHPCPACGCMMAKGYTCWNLECPSRTHAAKGDAK